VLGAGMDHDLTRLIPGSGRGEGEIRMLTQLFCDAPDEQESLSCRSYRAKSRTSAYDTITNNGEKENPGS
jgi:hypothetical protein